MAYFLKPGEHLPVEIENTKDAEVMTDEWKP